MAQRINTLARELSELKEQIPYIVVVNPQLMKAAIFDRDYKLIFGNADVEKYSRLAEKFSVKTVQGCDFRICPKWVEDAREDCVTYWLYNDGSTVHYLKAIARAYRE